MAENDFTIPIFTFFFFAILYYVFRKDAGDYTINKGVIEIMAVAFAIISGQTVLWISRYYMSQVTVNGFSGSILGRPVLLKDAHNISWVIFNTGEFLEPFHGKGKLATLVVPRSQINRSGKNYVGLTFVRKTPIKNLPTVVHSFLVHNQKDYNLNVIYFGKYSEQFIHQNPEITDFEAQVQNLYSQVNMRDDLLEGRNDILIEHKKFAEEMTDSKSRWTDVFRRKPEADKE